MEVRDDRTSISAGPFRARTSSVVGLVVLGLMALLAYVLHLTVGRPTDAQVEAQTQLATARNALSVEKADHEQLRADLRALTETVNRNADECRNEIAALRAAKR